MRTEAVRQRARATRSPSAATDDQTVVWRISIFDWDGPWGLPECGADGLAQFIRTRLGSFESMTWAEIHRGAGGRRGGNNSHPVKVDMLSKRARQRLAELR